MQAVQQRRQVAASGAKAASKKRTSSTAGRRKGNPGLRASQKAPTQKAEIASLPNDPFAASTTKEADPAMSNEDQERVTIVKQIQEQIVKRGQESVGGVKEEFEIERLLHGYVSMCHNAAMEFMKTNQTRAAGRMLRQCQDFLERGVPSAVAQIVLTKGIMHTIFNNLAQHANMVADMNTSIDYLEKALEAAERPEADQDLLPLAETYLNLANGYSFLNKYESALTYAEKALKFAKIRCNRLREEIHDERSKGIDGPNPKLESLDFQLNDFIAIKIMSHLCTGEQHEKLCNYNAAIKYYSEGKQFAETNFGTRHPLYTKCINSMGGARLKSKYQTKEVYRNVPSSAQTSAKPPVTKTKKTKKVKSPTRLNAKMVRESSSHEQNPIKSKLMARRLQASSQHGSRRNLQQAIQQSEVKMAHMMRNHQDNLLLSNCDTWTSMHCRHPRPRRRESLMVSIEKQKQRSGSRMRPTSACSERKLPRQERLTHDILDSMTDSKRAPYKVVCKVGPTCKNHNWSNRSPLKKVCTRGPNCFNHDWDPTMRSSFRSSMRSSKSTKMMHQQTEPAPVIQAPSFEAPAETEVQSAAPPEQSVIEVTETRSQDNHSCMLQQTERLHQQQMQHMRTMQEDQFKMLQLVIENQQSKTSLQSQSQQQQQQAYMYQPYMYPQFYAQGGYQQYPGMYAQYQHGAMSANDQGYDETGTSCTETEISEAEQIQEGRRPAQSELSRAEHYEHAYQQQQQQMQEMERRMSAMQNQYQQQLDQMRQSHEAFKMNVKARSERGLSQSSDKKVLSYKDFKEDETDINERVDEVLFGGDIAAKKNISHRNSFAVSKQALMRDQSAQVMDSFKQQNSILKGSTIKSKASFNDRTESPLKEGTVSCPRSENSGDRSVHSRHSRHISGRSVRSNTEKSFRVAPEQMRISKQEAAVKIQKNFKRYREQQDYQLLRNRGSQKKFLFKATVRGQESQIITCSVNVSAHGRPTSLSFVLSEARKPQRNQKAEIDLQCFDIRDSTDLKDKVLRIIREALCNAYIIAAIRESFQSELAREIIEAEFFSSDDQFELGRSSALGFDVKASQSSLQEVSEEPAIERKPSGVPSEAPVQIVDQKSLIDAEIERIRKKCDIQYRVNVDRVVVKGHQRILDEYETVDLDDEELRRHGKVDSDDESREINISRVDIRRLPQPPQYNEEGSDAESQHEYQFVLGERMSKQRQIKKLNMRQVILIQSLARGFLARLETKMRRHVLYCRILKKEEELVRFTLVKNRRSNYTLSANFTLKKNISRSKHLSSLPFEEAEVRDSFERCLVFNFEANQITELDLIGDSLPKNPFIENETHLFITDYKESKTVGEHLFKSFRLRDQYPCDIYEANEMNGDSRMHYFKVVVKHQNLKHYLKVQKLPIEIFYMAYYLNELLFLSFNSKNVFSYVYMKQMLSKRDFLKRMEQLEKRFFGAPRATIEQNSASQYSIDYSSYRKPLSHASRRFESKGDSVLEFSINRHDNEYTVQVFDDTEKSNNYQIYVKRRGFESDNDFMELTQVKLEMEDLMKYLRANLKIQLKDSGKIDYLSLVHDYKVFDRRKRRQKQEILQPRGESRVSSAGPARERHTDLSSLQRQSTDSFHGQNLHVVPQLETKLEDFTIQRNNRNYCVQVSERKNFDGLPLQITITAEEDSIDSKYMVFKNRKRMNNEELREYLVRHLLIYSCWDSENEREVIDYVSLGKLPEEYLRSATMSLASKESSITKKNLIKSRAGKLRVSSHDEGDMEIQENYSFTPQSQTLNQRSERLEIDLQAEAQGRLDSSWEELTRQLVFNGQQRTIVQLFAKQQQRTTRTRVPLPKGREDGEFYKILVINSTTGQTMAQTGLSVQVCNRLLKLDSASDLQVNKSAYLTIPELMKGRAQVYDQTQMDLMRASCAYLTNKHTWNHILKNVNCNEITRQVKFDVWSICQTIQSNSINTQPDYNTSPKKIQTVSISSKLSSNRKQAVDSYRQSQRNPIPAAATLIESGNSISKIDGGVEGVLSEGVLSEATVGEESDTSNSRFKIVGRDAPAVQRQSSMQQSSQAGSDFPLEDQDQHTQTKCQSIVKTSAGQFLNLVLITDGSDFFLTVTDRVRRGVQICESFELPMSFIDNIDDEGLDRLNAVKREVEDRLKSCTELTTINGQLNPRIFI